MISGKKSVAGPNARHILLVFALCISDIFLSKTHAQWHTSGKKNAPYKGRKNEDRSGKLENIAFVCAGFPWMYGPYQMQGDQLMKSLNKKFNFKTYWMMRGNNVHDIPPGCIRGDKSPIWHHLRYRKCRTTGTLPIYSFSGCHLGRN